jgi:hypothetical protein
MRNKLVMAHGKVKARGTAKDACAILFSEIDCAELLYRKAKKATGGKVPVACVFVGPCYWTRMIR